MLKNTLESLQESNLFEKVKAVFVKEKKSKILLIFSIFAFLIIVLVSSFFNDTDNNELGDTVEENVSSAVFDETVYEKDIENRLSALITNVEDVGKCQVMVTLEKGEYKIFAKDSYMGERENKDEYVILENKNGEDTGLVLNVVLPQIKGVAVVCEGGDSAVVKSEVVSIVTSVFSINSTQVSVSKMK